MTSLFIAASLALAAPPAAGPAAIDLRCYGLMVQLAGDDDPRVGAAGVTGMQYFLGRIDASAPGFDPDGDAVEAPANDAERGRLLGRCSALMGAAGRDFRATAERPARARDII